MIKPNILPILFLILSFQINPIFNSVSINLSSSMENISENSYEISNNIVTLKNNEEYIISGSCSECGIVVKKGKSQTIILDSITIDNSSTAPFVIKSGAIVNLILQGISTITDKAEDADEQAGIKFKSSSSLTISGDGTLIIYGYSKNGIKGASGSSLVINSGTFNVTCVNNGIAADGSVTINGGIFNIETTEGDGIKSDPDYNDTASEGRVTITGGTFNINSYNDGVQAKDRLIISGGTFNIKTFKDGSSSKTFSKNLYSAKGLKVSTNETSDISMIISGGTFNIDTADDALHSDGNITITKGEFYISTLDDGIHADQYLILGENGDDDNNVQINITKSKEGLEGAQIYIYSGTYNVRASDDGINSAGDTPDGCSDTGPGGMGGPGGRPRRNLNIRKLQMQQSECSTFHINIYGGNIYVNAESDGLDANGNINIYGGNIEVWGAQRNYDGDFADLDNTMTITGGTFFGGGNAKMIRPTSWKNSQKYIYKSSQVKQNYVVKVMSGTNIIKSYSVPKNIGYIYYTSPTVDSTYKFTISLPETNTPPTQETTTENKVDTTTENKEDTTTEKNKDTTKPENKEDTTTEKKEDTTIENNKDTTKAENNDSTKSSTTNVNDKDLDKENNKGNLSNDGINDLKINLLYFILIILVL